MRSVRYFLRAGVLLCVLASSVGASGRNKQFFLSSPDILPGSHLAETFVFNGFGCHGLNQSPALHWSHVPAGTQSFAVVLYDPDAPTGGAGWWHWVLYNISPTVTSLARDSSHHNLPAGAVQGRTDFKQHAFGGACPPVGDKPHRYIFTVYALNTNKIDDTADTPPALLSHRIQEHTIAQATLTAYYGR